MIRRFGASAGLVALGALAAWTVVALLLTLADLLGRDHPLGGWYMTIDHDAEHLALGGPLYQDPDDGYTATLYTPGLPFVLSLLYRVDVWSGWGIVVCTAALLALVALVASVAAPRRPRALDLVAAAGIGALALWLTTPLDYDLLYLVSTDHVAWPLALGGLLCGARAHRSPGAAIAAVALLSAAIWCKQTTIVAAVAFVLWLAVLAVVGDRRPRFVLAMAGALAAVNLVVLGALSLATDGWSFYFNFEVATEHPRVNGIRHVADYAVRAIPALVAAAALWAVVPRPGRPRRDSAAALLAFFLPFAVVAAFVGASKAGGVDNHFLGIAWTCGLLAALAWRRAQRDAVARARAGALVAAGLAALLVLTVAGSDRLTLGSLERDYDEPLPEVSAFARGHTLYHPQISDLDAGEEGIVYRDLANTMDLLAAGRQPRDLVRMFLDRTVDGVVPFAAILPDPGLRAFFEDYASGDGRQEANYLWKLDRVIEAGYAPSAAGAGIVERRPGPMLAPWMRECFGPFDLAGTEFRIRKGGGFWCDEGRDTITLRDTPAPRSELVADDSDAVDIPITVTLPEGGRFGIERGDWSAEGHRTGDALRLRVRDRTQTLPAAAKIVVEPEGEGELRLWATKGTTFDLSGLDL